MPRRAFLTLVVLALAAIGLVPLMVMFGKSLVVDGRLSLAHYQDLLASRRQWPLIKNSFALASCTTLLATAIGVPLGVLLARTDLPLRRLFTVLFTIPLVVPPYVTAVSWFHILGRQGLLSQWFGPSAAEWSSDRLFGLPGCALVLVSTFLPILMLLTITYLRTVHPRLEEAARLVCGWAGVLRGVTAPMILPGILLAASLVFLLTLGEFGVPIFLRYDVFPVESFMQFSAFYNFGAATAAAIPLALVTFLVLVAEWVLLREKVHALQPVSGSEPVGPIQLGRFRNISFLLVGFLCFVIVVLPFCSLLGRSASGAAYEEALSRAGDSLVRSLTYAALGACLLTFSGFFLGYLIHSRALAFWRSVDSLTLFLFALPGAVIGIGLVSLWNRPALSFLYGTPAMILLGYLAQYTVLASRITVSTLAQIPPSMEEAAQVMSAGWFRRMGWIIAPLAGRGLAAAWLVAYLFCLRDLGISMLVYPPGRDPFPVRTFTLMANGSAELIAALCVIMVLATLLPLGVLAAIFNRGVAFRGFH